MTPVTVKFDTENSCNNWICCWGCREKKTDKTPTPPGPVTTNQPTKLRNVKKGDSSPESEKTISETWTHIMKVTKTKHPEHRASE